MTFSTILCLNVLAALIAAWAYWPTVFWPREPDSEDIEENPGTIPPPNRPDRPGFSWAPPEPRFAWRRKAYLGGEVVSPLFHHPRAAGRWAAERGESAESLTFVEVVDGIAYRAEPHDAIVAIVESAGRQRGFV